MDVVVEGLGKGRGGRKSLGCKSLGCKHENDIYKEHDRGMI